MPGSISFSISPYLHISNLLTHWREIWRWAGVGSPRRVEQSRQFEREAHKSSCGKNMNEKTN
eukprot:1366030-Pleurochrysis_carterae.AAC.1